MMRARYAALPAALLALSLAACSAPEGQSTQGGSASADTLNIACSQQEDFCQAIVSAYTRETGQKATYVRLGAGEVLARLETNPGEFDVWSGGQAENHLVANDKGKIEKYVSKNASALPSQYNNAEGIWSGFYTDSIAFCSNKKELERIGAQAPTSWQDLLKPEFKGRIAVPHPATAGVGYMAMYTVATLNNGDQEKTVSYFKSAATGTEQAGRGEVAVAIALDSDCEKANKAGYSDLVTTYPSEGTGYEVGAVSVLAGARNPEGAKAYMDWLLTTKAQDLYADVPSFAAPTLPDAKVGPNVPKQDVVKHVDWDVRKAADSRANYIGIFESQIAGASSAK